MTLEELIDRLKKFDRDLIVRIDCPEGYSSDFLEKPEDVDISDNGKEIVFYGIFSVR